MRRHEQSRSRERAGVDDENDLGRSHDDDLGLELGCRSRSRQRCPDDRVDRERSRARREDPQTPPDDAEGRRIGTAFAWKISDGHVKLGGDLPTIADSIAVEAGVREVKGVTGVTNEIALRAGQPQEP